LIAKSVFTLAEQTTAQRWLIFTFKIIYIMAKTNKGKKIVTVKPHKRDGKKVKGHKRSTPN